jgi:hypothetical protein
MTGTARRLPAQFERGISAREFVFLTFCCHRSLTWTNLPVVDDLGVSADDGSSLTARFKCGPRIEMQASFEQSPDQFPIAGQSGDS